MSEIIIRIDGEDVTPYVLLSDAVFTTQAGGSPGTCKFRIKDVSLSRRIVVGKEMTLDIDGERVWGGFVMKCGRNFFFPVVDTDRRGCEPRPIVPRALVVEGVDYNILLIKRFMLDKANPKRVELKSYPAGTADDVIIREYATDYLDLSGDGIDTVTMVEHVGTPNPDKKGNPAAGGYSWAEALAAISRLTGAVDYIDPDKRLVHTDVDTPNAPFGLSDNPGPGQVGYRDLDIGFDGTSLRNDAMVWGAGQGADRVRFSRSIDTASVEDHGLWQVGDFRFDMWRQASVDKRARSFVYGSPQNKRGGKDDAVSAMVTVKQAGFRVAHKAAFESQIYDYADVIPIRRLSVFFVSPTQAMFSLVLSHYIDEPWNIFEFWFPTFTIPTPTIWVPPLENNGGYPFCPQPDGVPLFGDRFDRPSGQPEECGSYQSNTGVPTVPTQIDETTADMSFRQVVLDQPYSGFYEVIIGLDTTRLWLEGDPRVNFFTGIPGGPSVGNVSWAVKKRAGLPPDSVSGGVGGWLGMSTGEIGQGMEVEVGAAMVTGKVFVKLKVDQTGYHMKVWPQSQPEPGEQLWAPPRASGTVETFFGIEMQSDPTFLPLPVDSIGVFGLGGDTGLKGTGQTPVGFLSGNGAYQVDWGLAPPHGGVYFGYSDPPTSSISPIATNGDPIPSPAWSMRFGHEQFTSENMSLSHVEEVQAGFWVTKSDVQANTSKLVEVAPQQITITGEIAANLNGPGIAEPYGGGQPPVGFTVDLVAFLNGDTPPYYYNYAISGFVRSSIYLAGRGYATTGAAPLVWVPFSFSVTQADIREAGGRFVWGMRISDPVAAAAGQPTMGGGLLLPTSRTIDLLIRNVNYDFRYDGTPCGTHFCSPQTAMGGTSQNKVCEMHAERDGTILTLRPFQPNSVEIWADGLMLRPSVDFIELDHQHVTLMADLGSASSLKLCYLPEVVNGTSSVILGAS